MVFGASCKNKSEGGPGPLLQAFGVVMLLSGSSARPRASRNSAVPVPPLPSPSSSVIKAPLEIGSGALCRRSGARAEVRSKRGPRADKLPVKATTSGIGLRCPTRLRLDNIVVLRHRSFQRNLQRDFNASQIAFPSIQFTFTIAQSIFRSFPNRHKQ